MTEADVQTLLAFQNLVDIRDEMEQGQILSHKPRAVPVSIVMVSYMDVLPVFISLQFDHKLTAEAMGIRVEDSRKAIKAILGKLKERMNAAG